MMPPYVQEGDGLVGSASTGSVHKKTDLLLFTMLGIFLGKDPGGDRTQSLMFYISMFGEALMVFFLWRFSEKKKDRDTSTD